jgi:hypothetical protein
MITVYLLGDVFSSSVFNTSPLLIAPPEASAFSARFPSRRFSGAPLPSRAFQRTTRKLRRGGRLVQDEPVARRVLTTSNLPESLLISRLTKTGGEEPTAGGLAPFRYGLDRSPRSTGRLSL